MSLHWKRSLFTWLLLLPLSTLASHAHAVSITDVLNDDALTQELRSQLEAQAPADLITEISALSVNTPIWLSEHLPAMMAQGGLGAGIDMGDFFSVGVIPARVGLFNKFQDVAKGATLLGFEEKLPGNMIWPQFGVTGGLGLPGGLGIGGDFQMLPETDLGDESLGVQVSLISVAASMRWRMNKGFGPLPAFIVSFGASYYYGAMEMGAGEQSEFSIPLTSDAIGALGLPVDTGDMNVVGSYNLHAAPRMSWSLIQLNPELRLAWKLGPLRPYAGVGLGITYGEVRGGAKLSAEVIVNGIEDGDGNYPFEMEPIVIEESLVDFYKTAPAKFTLRPHVGVDLTMLGFFAITAQLDLAVMKHDDISVYEEDLDDLQSSFHSDSPGGMLTGGDSKIAAALVGTLALRLQF